MNDEYSLFWLVKKLQQNRHGFHSLLLIWFLFLFSLFTTKIKKTFVTCWCLFADYEDAILGACCVWCCVCVVHVCFGGKKIPLPDSINSQFRSMWNESFLKWELDHLNVNMECFEQKIRIQNLNTHHWAHKHTHAIYVFITVPIAWIYLSIIVFSLFILYYFIFIEKVLMRSNV